MLPLLSQLYIMLIFLLGELIFCKFTSRLLFASTTIKDSLLAPYRASPEGLFKPLIELPCITVLLSAIVVPDNNDNASKIKHKFIK